MLHGVPPCRYTDPGARKTDMRTCKANVLFAVVRDSWVYVPCRDVAVPGFVIGGRVHASPCRQVDEAMAGERSVDKLSSGTELQLL